MILLLGYGNPLRRDDGIGSVLAARLAERLQGDEVRVLLRHQLMPELVTSIAEAAQVFFLDARTGSEVGSITYEPLDAPRRDVIFTHHVRPTDLLGAARTWYGAAPKGVLISVVGASFEYGDTLSPEMTTRLPALLNEIETFINVQMAQEA